MQLRRIATLITLAPLLTGCATLRATLGGWAVGPNGIAIPQLRVRDALSRGQYDAVRASSEDDALLRALTEGMADYYAGEFAKSGAVLDTAALLADDRVTASVSRNALALVTNDMARAYQPRRTERLFLPYYGMLSYARLGAWEDAAVEARRMVSLLAQYAEDRSDAERPLHAAMEYLAGVVFERAGERGDAEVAYRIAGTIAGTGSATARRPGAGEGEVLVVLERGFVAHRATASIWIPLENDERDSIRSEHVVRSVALRALDEIDEPDEPDVAPRLPAVTPAARDATAVVSAPAFRQTPMPTIALTRRGGRYRHRHHDDFDVDQLAVAFPVLRRSARVWSAELTLSADGAVTPALRLSANIDDATAADERRERLSVATRAVARAAAKYAVTKAVRDKKGEFAGSLAELGANMLERADIRSWFLLPQDVELIRLRVPAGTRSLWLSSGSGTTARELRLPDVVVAEGEVAIVPVRLWRDGSASLPVDKSNER